MTENTRRGWDVKNRNDKEFDSDEGLNKPAPVPLIEGDAHPDIPAELPMVELKRNQVTAAIAKPDPDTDPEAANRALENVDINLPDVNIHEPDNKKYVVPAHSID